MRHVVSFILTMLIISCYSKKPEVTNRDGKPMPSIKFLLPDSTTYFDTKDIIAGNPAIIIDFGPSCPYSLAQLKEIFDNKNKLKNYRICLVTSWPFREMKNFYLHYELYNYPNIKVGYDYSNAFGNYFENRGVPYITLYGKDKRLKHAFMGKISTDQIIEIMNE